MPVSVNVSLDVIQREGTWLSVHVRLTEGSGSLEIPWDAAFGVQHLVIVNPEVKERLSAKTIKKRSSNQERRRIEAVGGRRHSGSGSKPGSKSDGSLGYLWRMENKFTTKESYRITTGDLHKLRCECINGQQPVFNIDFQDFVTGATKESWVLIPTSEWERLVLENKAAKEVQNATNNT